MSLLVHVSMQRVGGSEAQTVDARELHAALGVQDHFRTWISRRLSDGLFAEGRDFRAFLRESSGGRPAREYALTLDMAKHLAMLERTEKGHQVREYFIAVEKEHREAQAARGPDSDLIAQLLADPRRMLAATKELLERTVELEATVEAQRPAVAFTAAVSGAVNDMSIRDFAKVLGTGQNRLFTWLRVQRILYMREGVNIPHQRHIEAGRFVVVERTHKRGDAEFTHVQTRITGKGQVWLQRLWSASNSQSARDPRRYSSLTPQASPTARSP